MPAADTEPGPGQVRARSGPGPARPRCERGASISPGGLDIPCGIAGAGWTRSRRVAGPRSWARRRFRLRSTARTCPGTPSRDVRQLRSRRAGPSARRSSVRWWALTPRQPHRQCCGGYWPRYRAASGARRRDRAASGAAPGGAGAASGARTDAASGAVAGAASGAVAGAATHWRLPPTTAPGTADTNGRRVRARRPFYGTRGGFSPPRGMRGRRARRSFRRAAGARVSSRPSPPPRGPAARHRSSVTARIAR